MFSVSAVIPSLNRPLAATRAIDSALRQTVPPLEVIVVDDGSVPPLAEHFADIQETVKIVRNETPTGPAAARNRGAREASGDFIAFLDDDDEWVPWKLEVVHRCLAHLPDIDVVIHGTGTRSTDRAAIPPCSAISDPLERMLYRQPPHLDGVVVRRTTHIESPFDESFAGAEDLDYLIRLAKSGTSMVEVPAALALLGTSSDTAVGVEKRIEGRLRLLERHPEIAADRRALAFFFLRLGHQYRRSRQRVRALQAFGRSLTSRPSGAAARALAYSVFPSSLTAPYAKRQWL